MGINPGPFTFSWFCFRDVVATLKACLPSKGFKCHSLSHESRGSFSRGSCQSSPPRSICTEEPVDVNPVSVEQALHTLHPVFWTLSFLRSLANVNAIKAFVDGSNVLNTRNAKSFLAFFFQRIFFYFMVEVLIFLPVLFTDCDFQFFLPSPKHHTTKCPNPEVSPKFDTTHVATFGYSFFLAKCSQLGTHPCSLHQTTVRFIRTENCLVFPVSTRIHISPEFISIASRSIFVLHRQLSLLQCGDLLSFHGKNRKPVSCVPL